MPCLHCGAPGRTHTTCDRTVKRERHGDLYGYEHQQQRAALAPHVATGTTPCARCHQTIGADEPWDLGHPDGQSPGGPEHADCNRGKRPRPT